RDPIEAKLQLDTASSCVPGRHGWRRSRHPSRTKRKRRMEHQTNPGPMRGDARSWLAIGVLVVVLGAALAIVLTHRHGPSPTPSPGPVAEAASGVDGFSAPPGAIPRLEQAMGRPFGAFSVYAGLPSGGAFPNAVAREAMTRHALIYLNINSSKYESGHKVPMCWS